MWNGRCSCGHLESRETRKGGKLPWFWLNIHIFCMTMKELFILPWLCREPSGNKPRTSAPSWSQEAWEMAKLLLSPAAWTYKGARKCKPSPTWVSKKSDTRALGDAGSHIHLTGLRPPTLHRVQPGPSLWGCIRPYLLAGLQGRGSQPHTGTADLSGSGSGRGVGQSLDFSLGKEPSLLPRQSNGLGWRPDLLP